MKKGLLLAVMLVASYHLFAFTTQGVWRWRKDDGSETSATWLAAQNTPVTITSADSALRLRIELYNNGSGGTLDDALFEDSSNEAGSHWDTIKAETNASAFVLAGTSPNVTDLQPTTSQLTGQPLPYTFVAGKMIVSSDKLPAQTLPKGARTEFEYVFRPSANIKPGVTYYFRVDAANYLIGYAFPSLTTAAVLPVNITGFSAQAQESRVRLQWTTLTETNNARFDVERSSDGRTWNVAGSTKGSGTSGQAHTYTVFDNSPIKGVNYYRIKQYDANGKWTASTTAFVTITSDNNIVVSVFPNPAKGKISFNLKQYAGGNLLATLTDGSGKIVHRETIKSAQQDVTYTLQMNSQPAPGMYILHIKGDNFSETKKVLVP